MTNRFRETYNSMREAVGYEKPLSYQEWLNLRDDYKAAWLYVQFFDQISLAWYKVSVNNIHADADNGVSEMLSYCVKNVSKIVDDQKRFTPNYMYRVAYNCLYCIAIDRVGYKMTYEKCVSQYVNAGDGDELNIFDTVAEDKDPLSGITQKDIALVLDTVLEQIPDTYSKTKPVSYIERNFKNGQPIDEVKTVMVDYTFREEFKERLQDAMNGGHLRKADEKLLKSAFAKYAKLYETRRFEKPVDPKEEKRYVTTSACF